jgi:erythromycin esterase-like protein
MTVPGHQYKTMRLPYLALLDRSPNFADINTCISVIHLFFYQPPSISMPIDLSNLSAEDIAAATAAVEAARKAHEERERREAEKQQRQQGEERVCQAATARREAEARKAEAERRYCLAREKAAREAAVAEEQRHLLATGLSGLKLTIPAPSSIVRTASGSSTQSKGKRKAMEEDEDKEEADEMDIDQTLRD